MSHPLPVCQMPDLCPYRWVTRHSWASVKVGMNIKRITEKCWVMSIYIFRSISQSIDIDSHSVQVSPFQEKKIIPRRTKYKSLCSDRDHSGNRNKQNLTDKESKEKQIGNLCQPPFKLSKFEFFLYAFFNWCPKWMVKQGPVNSINMIKVKCITNNSWLMTVHFGPDHFLMKLPYGKFNALV